MNVPVQQHYVPRLHLEHFAGTNPAGQVWVYEGQVEPRSQAPAKIAKQRHYYSVEIEDGVFDTRIETHLGEVEGRANDIYRELLRGNIPHDDQKRADFSTFLALMYVRTPAMRRMAGEMIGQLIQIRNYAVGMSDEAFNTAIRKMEAHFGEKLDDQMRENVRNGLIDPSSYVIEIPKEYTMAILSSADKLAPILFNMRWSILMAKEGYFVTSDNPIVRRVDPKTIHPIMGDGGIHNDTVEITFPLSPKVCLLISRTSYAPEIISVGRKHVEALNHARAAYAERYIFSHIKDKRVQKLTSDYINLRQGITIHGFRPEKFAPVEIRRSSRKEGRK